MATTEIIKPKVRLVGENGNVFSLVGICSRVLKVAGQADKAKEMRDKVLAANDYDEALSIVSQYCDIQ